MARGEAHGRTWVRATVRAPDDGPVRFFENAVVRLTVGYYFGGSAPLTP